MRFSVCRNVAGLLTAMLFVSGCGGSQGQSPGVGVVPQSAVATSSIRPGTSGDLIYATGGCGGTCVISYPDGTLVGSLDSGRYSGSGACVDSNGNVFIANYNEVQEYAHGGASPIATLSLPGKEARGCSVDALTGNLAVAFLGQGYDIAIFQGAQGTPTLYLSGAQSYFCGYDDAGNLFVNGIVSEGPALAELAYGSSSFIPLSISNKVGSPGQLQWDGSHMTWESLSKHNSVISRLSIQGSSATVVATVALKGIRNRAAASWINDGSVIVPFATHGPDATKIGTWSYPNGGKRIATYKQFAGKDASIQAVTLSQSETHLLSDGHRR